MDREAIANALQGKRITNRGMLVPRVEYDDGSQGWGVPGLIMEPVEAWQRLQAGAGDNLARMQQGLPFDPQSAGDAFAVTGAAALGSVAAPKPAGAYVTSGAPMRGMADDAARALPMDEAARMARAKEMGFDTDTTWYHGTKRNTPIETFDPANIDGYRLRESDVSSFFTSDVERANAYAGSYKDWRGNDWHSDSGAVYPVYAKSDDIPVIDMSNPADVADILRKAAPYQDQRRLDVWPSEWTQDDLVAGGFLDDGPDRLRDSFAAAFDALYDGQYIVRDKDGSSTLVVTEPNRIRSRFAAFDPAKADSADLLAANPKEAAALSAAVQGEKQSIRAYHGSPHDFDKFDISKMGTGEGAQAYGAGLYFAEAEDVARSYRDNLSRFRDMEWDGSRISDDPRAYNAFRDAMETPESWRIGKIVDFVAARGGAHDDVMREARHYFDDRKPEWKAAFDEVDSRLKTFWKPGRMYEVRIDADPNDFLDWDAPWTSQSAAVQRAMREAGVHPERNGPFGTKEIPDTPISISAERALRNPQHMIHETLKEQSVPGIKYLDQGSRGAGQGSRNYVVFDDSLISIVKKYGIAGAASLYGMTQGETNRGTQSDQSLIEALRTYLERNTLPEDTY